jgi:hypothetical protein
MALMALMHHVSAHAPQCKAANCCCSKCRLVRVRHMQRTLQQARSSNSRSNGAHATKSTQCSHGRRKGMQCVTARDCTAGEGLIVAHAMCYTKDRRAHAMCAAQRCALLIPLLGRAADSRLVGAGVAVPVVHIDSGLRLLVWSWDHLVVSFTVTSFIVARCTVKSSVS